MLTGLELKVLNLIKNSTYKPVGFIYLDTHFPAEFFDEVILSGKHKDLVAALIKEGYISYVGDMNHVDLTDYGKTFV